MIGMIAPNNETHTMHVAAVATKTGLPGALVPVIVETGGQDEKE